MGSDGRQKLNISPGGIEQQFDQANLVIRGVSTFKHAVYTTEVKLESQTSLTRNIASKGIST